MLTALLFAVLAHAGEPGLETDDPGVQVQRVERRIPLTELLAPLPGEVTVFIDKSERRLTVKKGGVDVRSYRVGLATTPTPGDPDKVRRGDKATPEGDFTIVTRLPESSFHKFMGISYPNAEDADRGLAAGLITPEQAQAIREADAVDRLPPWNTTLGGAIGIHGGGSQYDWTLGCIAVTNEEVDELWEVLPYKTRVRIVK